ncbi:MAG: hypothetical protein HN521_12965 [Candidatus Latescibacteria bacterium]|jgi:hypothetical protein|nr:hypothetical protein [Candidatus Latescibacterota bacterium]MBT5829145.1 hypothetical protein [Candidatus Latescibacterota bacterium]
MLFVKKHTENGFEIVLVLEEFDRDLMSRRRSHGAWEPVIGELVREPVLRAQDYSDKIMLACALFGAELLDGGMGQLMDIGGGPRGSMLSGWNTRR